jgi:hypothetical protein
MKTILQVTLIILCGVGVIYSPAYAGQADVVRVEVTRAAPGVYSFRVTLRHDDAGWDHYADRCEVRDAEGTVLGTRVLAHPHVDEQPFTRGLSGVAVPHGLSQVTIAAHDSVHGHGGIEMTVVLPE